MTEKTCYTRIFNTVIPELFKRRMKRYYEEEFAEQPDLLSVLDVANLTGYSKMFIGKLIQEGTLRSVTASRVRYINKALLIDYLCTDEFDSILRKTYWHKKHVAIFRKWKRSSRW